MTRLARRSGRAPDRLGLLLALACWALVACLAGCGGAPVQPQPAGSLVLYTITDECACWGVTKWSGSTRTDLGWGDAYHADGPRTVVTYRGQVVVVYPPPRRARRAR